MLKLAKEFWNEQLLSDNKSILAFFKSNRAKLAVFFNHAAERRFRIVVEKTEPVFARRLRQQTLLGFERFDRVKIVAHYPCRWNVRACGHEVCKAKECLIVAIQARALHSARMSRNRFHA